MNLTGIRDQIFDLAFLYKTLHLKVFKDVIDRVVISMEYFTDFDYNKFMKFHKVIMMDSVVCQARASVLAAIHNRLCCNIEDIKCKADKKKISVEEELK